jgi:hypothetical protein
MKTLGRHMAENGTAACTRVMQDDLDPISARCSGTIRIE